MKYKIHKGSVFGSLPVFCFLFFWLFASFVYGDVFYMAGQYSFFSFEEETMRFVREQPGGVFLCLGRFLLLTFHAPLLGGCVWAFLMTGIVCLTKYTFGLYGRREWLSLLPSGFVSIWMLHKGLNLYYQAEPAWVFLLPLGVLAGISLAACLRRAFAKRPTRTKRTSFSWAMCGILAAALASYAWFGKQAERITASMQRAYMQQDWDAMLRDARRSSQPTRAIAAYHAIALLQKGQLMAHWLDIPYQYPDLGLTNRGGMPDDGSELYLADACLAAGLIYPAYHQAMERMVIDGPSCYVLKQLLFCALLNNEQALANKYLYLLMQVPFEGRFVRKYLPYVRLPERVMSDAYFQNILGMTPMSDSFEQAYRSPLFIGYNVQTNRVRSALALEASIVACLYAKMLPGVVQRAQVYGKKALPPLVEQAVALYAMEHPEVLSRFQVSPSTVSEVANFVEKYGQCPPENRKALRKKYGNFYPYYYYFQNQIDEEQLKKYEVLMKGGVN